MTGDNNAKNDRDPIFTVCLAIFVIAAIAVVGVYINDHYFSSSDDVASNGNSVSVEYIGTYYDYYGNEKAVLFDTTYYSIAKSDMSKAHDFEVKKESQYSKLTYTIGNNSLLPKFANAVIGHQVGDVIKVKLSADQFEGYVSSVDFIKMGVEDVIVESSVVIPYAEFKEVHSDIKLSSGASYKFTSVYGWDATASLTKSGNAVLVTYLAQKGESYEVTDGKAKVKYYITDIDETGIHCKLVIDNWTGTMVKTYINGKQVYITEYNEGKDFTYKTCAEKCNQDLYFEIKLVSVN